jgi:hypothetical protein
VRRLVDRLSAQVDVLTVEHLSDDAPLRRDPPLPLA